MALEKQTVDAILTGIQAMEVETRLASINQAMTTFSGLFGPDKQISELAFNAMYIESLYNLVREELKQSFKTLVPGEVAESIGTEVKRRKEKSEKTPAKKKKASKMTGAELGQFLRELGIAPPGLETKS